MRTLDRNTCLFSGTAVWGPVGLLTVLAVGCGDDKDSGTSTGDLASSAGTNTTGSSGGGSVSTDLVGSASGDGSTSGSTGGEDPPSTEARLTRLLTALDLGRSPTPWVATGTRRPLMPGQVLRPAHGLTQFSPAGPYNFTWLDPEPHARFGHSTSFVYSQVGLPDIVESQASWPLLNGEGFIVADLELVKLFSPDTVLPSRAYPGDATKSRHRAAAEMPVFGFYPDYAGNSGAVRVFVNPRAMAPGGGEELYLHVLADLNGNGRWEPEAGERIGHNLELVGEGNDWQYSPEFSLPVNANNKFTIDQWVRISITREPMPEIVLNVDLYCDEGLGASCTDEYYDYSTWAGPDCDSGTEASGCLPTITWGPQFENPPVPMIEGARSTFICQPDDLVIPTKTKVLVMNAGDTAGRTDSEYEMNKAAALFALHYGDDAVAKLNNPTAERALESIRALVKELSCLDEAHIYISAHGAPATGELWFVNAYGGITPAQLKEAITSSAEHCPSPMNFATSEGCRQGGYCNLSIYLTSCYSGKFLEGEDSLALPGLNVLTAASGTSPAYAELTGLETGEQVGHAFVQGFVDNKADKMPYGNGDGITTPEEAQRYAIEKYAMDPKSDPKLHQGADCNCVCEAEGCGNGQLDDAEACDPAEAVNRCSTNFACSGDCKCICALSQADCGDGEVFDPEACACTSISQCPGEGSFDLRFVVSTLSDPSGHSCCHKLPLDVELRLPMTREGDTFASPGLPGQDIPPLTGRMQSSDVDGCSLSGSGSGDFADFPDSRCTLQNATIDGTRFRGELECTPSGFPDEPILFGLEGRVEQ